MSVRVVFLGPPGAGKGTQARTLAREWGIPQIATGDMLREAAAAGTPGGLKAKRIMDTGALVPDDVIMELMSERLRAPDAARGFILDGVPRTIVQAEAIEALLKDLGQDLDRVVYFDVPEQELLRRLTGRRLCRACGTPFHLVTAPPKTAGRCDRCGGELYQRDDDKEETVKHRLDVYTKQTAPLLGYYRNRSRLVTVPAGGAIDAIADAIRRAVAR
jgi:adenylate kinase